MATKAKEIPSTITFDMGCIFSRIENLGVICSISDNILTAFKINKKITNAFNLDVINLNRIINQFKSQKLMYRFVKDYANRGIC